MDYERYRTAIRRKVCQHCIDLGADGKCTLTNERQCGVEIYLDKIVDVVHSVHSQNLQDYVDLLRKKVCANCKNQRPDGTCQIRNEIECGLDRYFALVVEAIEEADA